MMSHCYIDRQILSILNLLLCSEDWVNTEASEKPDQLPREASVCGKPDQEHNAKGKAQLPIEKAQK